MKSIERLWKKVFLFIIISGLLNYYVLSMLFGLFGVEKHTGFMIIWIVGSVSYLLGAELLRHFNNWLVKSISIFFSTWMGVAFTFLWVFGIYEIFTLIFPRTSLVAGFVALGVSIILIFYSLYNASTYNVRTIRVESEKLKKPLRIVQLSDLHIGSTHKNDFLSKTVERVNELDPDFVVITGDLIDGMHHYKDDEFLCLSNIKAPIFFVLGNHEQFINISRVYDLLERTHIKFLRNVAIVHEGIQIIGIDDTSNKEVFLRNLKSVAIDNNKFTLLLYHRPCVFDEVSKEDVDLMLSGHTHGGQLFPINVLLSIIDGPVRGLHKKNNTILYVSTGTGWWGPPMRLGSRNEITLINLIPKYVEHSDYPLIWAPDDEEAEKLRNPLKNNHPIKNAEIISLMRGKKALIENKHSKVLYDIDKLLADTESYGSTKIRKSALIKSKVKHVNVVSKKSSKIKPSKRKKAGSKNVKKVVKKNIIRKQKRD